MIIRNNPLAILVPGSVPDNFYDQLEDLHDKIMHADSARSQWIQKQENLLNQRLGIRKPKNFPWPNANNKSWPLTDSVGRRWKPGLIGLVANVEPVSYFFGTNPEASQRAGDAQTYYHHRFSHIPELYLTLSELADNIYQHGLAFTRQGWKYRTDVVCRIVRLRTFFPDGPIAAAEQANAQLAAARQQLQAAIEAGQAPPEALSQLPGDIGPQELIVQTLEKEYGLSRQNPTEAQQLQAAAQAFMTGQEEIKLAYRAVIQDGLDWKVIAPFDMILPPRMRSLDDAEFVAIIHRLSADEIRKMARDGYFNVAKADLVASKLDADRPGVHATGGGDRPELERLNFDAKLDRMEGISPAEAREEDVGVIYEVYCKLDLDRDGLKERVVLWYHPDSKTCLTVFRYPYPFPEWPITLYVFERRTNRLFSSRGGAEMLSTFQAEVNKQHNTRLDAMQLSLMPMFQMRASAGELKKNIKFFPGSIIPVQAVGDFAPVPNNLAPLQHFMIEENFTKQMAEQYMGVFDPGLLAQNTSERRTAREIEAVTSQIDTVFGQDARLFQSAMQRTHKQLWYLLLEYDSEDIYLHVTGSDQPLQIKKADIAHDYDIVPAGTPNNSSRMLELSRAREALQVFMPDLSGLIDREQLYKWYFSLLDRNRAKLIVRDAQTATAVQTVMSQAQQLTGQPQPF